MVARTGNLFCSWPYTVPPIPVMPLSARTNVTQVSAPKLLSQHRPEYMVPKCCADTIVSGRKSVMALMMFEQW
jgi:hypothetical protein